MDLYDDVLDDDDSAVGRSQVALLGRQDSEPVAEAYLPNRSSSASSVHRSRSYTDDIASAATETSTASATDPAAAATAAAAPRKSEAHNRPRSASALTRPRIPSAVEGQLLAPEAPVGSRVARRMRSCEPSPSATALVDTATSTEPTVSGDQMDAALANSTGDDSGSDDTGGPDSGGGARPRLNQRRAVRAERRYHTADTIHDIDARSAQDNAIHKRLSLNYGGARTQLPAAVVGDCTLRLPECSSSALSCESLGSFPSSSGVSSTASLCRINDDVGDDVSSDVDPKLASHDDGLRDLQDVESTDEPTDRGTQCQTSTTSDGGGGGGLTAAQRLQLLVAERRRLNQELLFMNPALEAS